MARGKRTTGQSSKELWIDYEPQGQPRWESNGFRNTPSKVRRSYPGQPEDGYIEREQRSMRIPFDVQEVVDYFDKWVTRQKSKMWYVVWKNSLRQEILTGEETSKEYIQALSFFLGEEYPNELYRSTQGTLKLARERWLNNFYQTEKKFWVKLAEYLQEKYGLGA